MFSGEAKIARIEFAPRQCRTNLGKSTSYLNFGKGIAVQSGVLSGFAGVDAGVIFRWSHCRVCQSVDDDEVARHAETFAAVFGYDEGNRGVGCRNRRARHRP